MREICIVCVLKCHFLNVEYFTASFSTKKEQNHNYAQFSILFCAEGSENAAAEHDMTHNIKSQAI